MTDASVEVAIGSSENVTTVGEEAEVEAATETEVFIETGNGGGHSSGGHHLPEKGEILHLSRLTTSRRRRKTSKADMLESNYS